MGWASGLNREGREVGYAVEAECDRDGCSAVIDRGLAYACGNEHDGGALGCGRYFCGDHLAGGANQLCADCAGRPVAQLTDVLHDLRLDEIDSGRRSAGEMAQQIVAELDGLGVLLVADDGDRHIIQFTDHGWVIAHPLSERLDLDSLFACDQVWNGGDTGARGRFVLIDSTTLGDEVS